MTVLGSETSSVPAGIAIIRDAQVMTDVTLEIGAVYAEKLPEILERSMVDLNLNWTNIDGLAVSIGPGSYTGLRVGLSLVKGFAYVIKRPIIAVPTLDSIAYQVPYCHYPVHVLTDARRGRVYEAKYDTTSGKPKRITEFRVGLLEELIENIMDKSLFIGNGADAYQSQITTILGSHKVCFRPPGTGRLMAA